MNLDKLNQRERYAVYLAGAFICLFILFQFVVFPLTDGRDRVRRTLRGKEQALREIRNLRAEYETLRGNSQVWQEKIKRRPRSFTLFSFMDQLAKKAEIKIDSMKPSTSRPKNSPYAISKVELKLVGINMKQLAAYLHMVETSENMVFIRRISVTKKGKEGYIDLLLQVETFEARSSATQG